MDGRIPGFIPSVPRADWTSKDVIGTRKVSFIYYMTDPEEESCNPWILNPKPLNPKPETPKALNPKPRKP